MNRKSVKSGSVILFAIILLVVTIIINFDNKRFVMIEKIVKVNDVDICTESIGNPDNPPVLLIMGATASMIWWDEQFCQKLVNRGYYVIRYDNRDTGKSTYYEPGIPPYSVMDLASDAIAVLDSYNIKKAHIVGMSLGGMLSQIITIRHADRVLSSTIISSSVWDDSSNLPQMDKKLIDYYSTIGSLDWSNKNVVKQYIIGNWRLLNGSKYSFDENRANQLAEIEIKRSRNIKSMFNHAMLTGGEDLYGKSNQINVPVLIIHGTEDPVLPFPHAEALHKTISDSKLIKLDGRGHEIHKEDWDMIIIKMDEHMRSVR